MKIATAIAIVGLAAMTAVLGYAFSNGDFSAEGARLTAMPWGIVSLVDLYVGFALFSCWIVFREQAWLPSIVWVILMMVLGFWAGALYTLLALRASRGDWHRFWLGNRAAP
jgi:cytochrome bd-type quinol oxidase subunit 2